ncbi:MAG: DUF58 domain-containing protein [Lachnospiraceae bacterium]|nr:DUF58 domain-containing protein [Lachnospiraceae bacterium]
MRRNRIIWLVSWIISIIGISFYGGPVSFGSLIVITAIPAVSLLYILCVIIQFKVYQKIDARNLVCDHPDQFYLTLQNESFISFSGIRIGFFPDFSTISGLDDGIEYELAPKTGIKKQTRIVCRYRGEYEVGISRIIVTDFFRLFTVTYKNREPLRVIVKPNIISVPQIKGAVEALNSSGDPAASRTEPDVLVREYVPTDDSRMINWKATAVTGKLMVREYTGTQRRGIGIIMDPKRYSDTPKEYLPVENKILETVIALTLFFSDRNIPVSVYSKDKEMTESIVSSPGQFDAFYEIMSSYGFDERENIAGVFEEVFASGAVTGKSAMFIVVHEIDEECASYIKKLGTSGMFVTVYVVSDCEDRRGLIDNIPRCSICCVATDADIAEVL